MMKRLLPLAALLLPLMAACNSISDSSFQFEYEAERLEEPPSEPPEVVAVVFGPGAFLVRGGATTPCFFDRVALDARRTGQTLTVRILRQAANPCTDDTTRHHAWSGIFTGLAGGTYTLRVENTVAGGNPVLVHEQALSIP